MQNIKTIRKKGNQYAENRSDRSSYGILKQHGQI